MGEDPNVGAPIDEDYDTSLVAGAPAGWGDDCLEVSVAHNEIGYVAHNFAPTEYVRHALSIEFISSNHTSVMSAGDYVDFWASRDGGMFMYWLRFVNAGGSPKLNLRIYHDGAQHSYLSTMDIAEDTCYKIEVRWDNLTFTWHWTINGVVQRSGFITLSAQTRKLDRIQAGCYSQAQLTTGTLVYYLDNICLSSTHLPSPSASPSASPSPATGLITAVLEEVEELEEIAPKRYSLNPLREHSFDAVEEHLVELNDIIVSISKDISRLEGRDDETPKIYNDMNFNKKRATNLRDPVDDQDAVTLNYFRRWLKRYLSEGFEPGQRL